MLNERDYQAYRKRFWQGKRDANSFDALVGVQDRRMPKPYSRDN